MDQRLLLDSPSRGLLALGGELETACGYLEREPVSGAHLRAAEAIVAATLDDVLESMVQLERAGAASPGDSEARRGFAAIVDDLERALDLLHRERPSTVELLRAKRIAAAVASLLYWSATELQIKTLPTTDEPLV